MMCFELLFRVQINCVRINRALSETDIYKRVLRIAEKHFLKL